MPLPMFQEGNNLPPLSQIKYVVGITSGKGGVGKSTVTVNLAYALQSLGYTVGILDADLYGPSIQKMVPEDRPAMAAGDSDPDCIIPAFSSGIELISMAYFRPESEGVVVRAPIANGVIDQFIQKVKWSKLDFLLIDFPPGTGDIQLSLCQKGQLCGALLVSTPQEIALLDVVKNLDFLRRVKVPVLGMIENMSYLRKESGEKWSLFGEGNIESFVKNEAIPFLGQIPIEEEVRIAGDRGKSLLASSPKSESSTKFKECAKNLVEQIVQMAPKKGYTEFTVNK